MPEYYTIHHPDESVYLRTCTSKRPVENQGYTTQPLDGWSPRTWTQFSGGRAVSEWYHSTPLERCPLPPPVEVGAFLLRLSVSHDIVGEFFLGQSTLSSPSLSLPPSTPLSLSLSFHPSLSPSFPPSLQSTFPTVVRVTSTLRFNEKWRESPMDSGKVNSVNWGGTLSRSFLNPCSLWFVNGVFLVCNDVSR